MKRDDIGYDPETGAHNARLTRHEAAFVGCLWDEHTGYGNRISAGDLAVKFAASLGVGIAGEDRDVLEAWKRDVRRMQNHMLRDHRHVPILTMAGIGGGYWIAETEYEADMFYATFRKRALTGLVKATRGKQAAMVDVVQQLTFEFGDLADRSGLPPERAAGTQAPVEVVDKFLAKMLQDPTTYAAGLRRLGRKYGGVLLAREQVTAMKDLTGKLNTLIAEMEA